MDPLKRLSGHKREFGEHGGVNASIEVSTTFTVMKPSLFPALFAGEVCPEKGGCYVYGRSYNPTVRYLGRQIAALEGTDAAYPCSSGMAALSTAIFALCNTGDHIVASNAIYGGSYALLKAFLPAKCGITTTFVDITNLEEVEAALKQKNTKVLYTETLSNPTLVVADLPVLADLAHAAGAQLVVDNTFTPLIVTPARWGADVVIHSMTKFISGASDIIAGVICGNHKLVQSLTDFFTGPVMLLGPTLDPRIASELSLRLAHLAVRIQEHSRRALALAEVLKDLGANVTYPGLPQHPQHNLLARLSNPGYGFGGMLGVDLGTSQRAEAFMDRLQNHHAFGLMAVSLGYFETLMSLSGASTSSELTEEEKAAAGLSPGYVRLSIGLTGTQDQRCEQLKEAYQYVVAKKVKDLGKDCHSVMAQDFGSNDLLQSGAYVDQDIVT